jgi:membrane associated rhomboid family serine protease
MRSSPFETRRSATVMLLVANAVAFVLECLWYHYPPRFQQGDYFALSWWGLSHGYVWQLLTFQFMHGGLLHLLFNCWAIYVFGREVEAAFGVKRFLTLYFASGVIGGLVQAGAGGLATRFPTNEWMLHFAAPTVGASAGAFGLLAAFAMLYPERPLMLLLFFVIPLSMRAKFLLLISGLLALFGVLFPVSNIADAAHLGGMLTGILFVRYAAHWEWHWPRLRRSGGKPPLRLVKVGAGGSGRWNRAKGGRDDDELPADEFLSKEVDPILDKISAQGIQSLTERERRILEVARERMRKR